MSDVIGRSILQLEKLFFEDVQYKRSLGEERKSINYEMNFNREISGSPDGIHFKVSLVANVWSKEDQEIQLRIALTGLFICDCENEALKQELVRYNTVAIMFPYLRSQISLVSTQPDMPPITIPPMNIVGLFKEVDQRENQNQQ